MTFTFAEYQAAAMRTAPDMGTLPLNLVHASLGMRTESGEFQTCVKRAFAYGEAIDAPMKARMAEEVGDLLWYCALAAEHLGVPLAVMAQENIAKLRIRYPDKFTQEAAEARADKGGVDARGS